MTIWLNPLIGYLLIYGLNEIMILVTNTIHYLQTQQGIGEVKIGFLLILRDKFH